MSAAGQASAPAMMPDLRNARGQGIGLGPAQFFAANQPRQPGPHRLSVELSLTDGHQRPVPLQALQTGPAGRLKSSDFGLNWQASEPGLWLMCLRLPAALPADSICN